MVWYVKNGIMFTNTFLTCRLKMVERLSKIGEMLAKIDGILARQEEISIQILNQFTKHIFCNQIEINLPAPLFRNQNKTF